MAGFRISLLRERDQKRILNLRLSVDSSGKSSHETSLLIRRRRPTRGFRVRRRQPIDGFSRSAVVSGSADFVALHLPWRRTKFFAGLS
jgi:hypothetical protein